MLFEHEAYWPCVQTSSDGPASVNTMKQICVIVILAYFTLFQPKDFHIFPFISLCKT